MKMNNNNIPYDLIGKHLNGETSHEEDEQLWIWLEERPQRVRYFEETVAWYSGFDAPVSQNELQARLEEIYANADRRFQQHDRYPYFWKIAASVLLLSIACASLIGRFSSEEVIVGTVAGERRHIILPDSTSVWLNGNSKLCYNSGIFYQAREVSLQGEGFFTVTSGSMPFVIHYDSIRATLTSGSLNIQAYPGDVEKSTVVADGIVHFEDMKNPEWTLIATTGEEVVSIDNYGLLSASVNTNVNFDGWVTGRYAFDDEPVRSIVALLEKGGILSGVRLEEKMRYQTVSGVFEFHSPFPAQEFVTRLKREGTERDSSQL